MSEPPADLPAPDLPLAASPPAARPKLSIAHLMLWTLGTAIVLAFSRTQLSMFEPARANLDNIFKAQSWNTYLKGAAVVVSPFTGAALAMFVAAVWQLVRRKCLALTEPGHWLLLIAGATFVKSAAVQLVQFAVMQALILGEGFDTALTVRALVTAVGSAAIAALSFLAWWRTQEPSRWRFYFFASSSVYGLAAWGTILVVLSSYVEQTRSPLVIILAILIVPLVLAWIGSFPWAVGKDLWCKQRRDWLHCVGVVVVMVTAIAAVANGVVPILFMR